jgi:hypothetical protein
MTVSTVTRSAFCKSGGRREAEFHGGLHQSLAA